MKIKMNMQMHAHAQAHTQTHALAAPEKHLRWGYCSANDLGESFNSNVCINVCTNALRKTESICC